MCVCDRHLCLCEPPRVHMGERGCFAGEVEQTERKKKLESRNFGFRALDGLFSPPHPLVFSVRGPVVQVGDRRRVCCSQGSLLTA